MALSWVLFVDLVKAFESVPLDVLFTVLAKFGGVSVIKRMNTDLQVIFDLNGEPVAVPCTVGVKQGCPLSPTCSRWPRRSPTCSRWPKRSPTCSRWPRR